MSEEQEKVSIFCVQCDNYKQPRLTTGNEIYPHLPKLSKNNFYKCDDCGNYVGCHKNGSKPLGVIATIELRNARQHIHRILDPIWKNNLLSRGKLYKKICNELGYQQYHTANIKSIDEARKVYAFIVKLKKGLKK